MGVHRRLTLAALLVACAASLAAASGVFATATWLNAGTGFWHDGANWSTLGEPTAADDAVVNNGGTVEITSISELAQSLNIGSVFLTSGTVVVPGGQLGVGDLTIGDGGTGVLNLESGGVVEQTDGAGSNLLVGNAGNGVITVDGTPSILDWDGGFAIFGLNSGAATITLTDGGRLHNADIISLGGAGSSGTINVGDGGTAGVLRADINAPAGFGTATVHFNHTDGITFSNALSGGVRVRKSGAGGLTFTGANTHTGGTTIHQGMLTGNSGSLPGGIVTSFGGNVTFNQAVDGTYAGVVSGGGTFSKSGAGVLTLTGTNTYALTTWVADGTLRAGAPGVVPPNLVLLSAGGTFDLNGHNQTIGNLQGPGAVTLGAASLTFGGEGDDFSGIMSGTGTVTKTGTGLAIFSGNNTYTGATTVTDGRLFVNGSQPSSTVTLTGGTLGGTGTVGAITATGGRVAPGVSPGILSSGSVSFDGATTFVVEIDGTAAGSGYDVLDVTGTVALGGATLDVISGFAPASGAEFVIIDNDGADAVTGTFAGLVEGDAFSDGGQTFAISYAGGDGNDVTLTAGPETVIAPGTLPAMTVGTPFSVTFTASGGAAPYTFAVSAGTLPAGLALDGATGELSGTPTTAGAFSFSITATDSLGSTDVQPYAGDVLPASVPSMPMLGFLGLAVMLGVMGYARLRAGAA